MRDKIQMPLLPSAKPSTPGQTRAPALKADRLALAFLPFSLCQRARINPSGVAPADVSCRCRCHGLMTLAAPAPLAHPEKSGAACSRTIIGTRRLQRKRSRTSTAFALAAHDSKITLVDHLRLVGQNGYLASRDASATDTSPEARADALVSWPARERDRGLIDHLVPWWNDRAISGQGSS